MRILFIDTVHEHLASHLTRMDFECEDGSQLSRDEILGKISDYEGVVIRSRIMLDKELPSVRLCIPLHIRGTNPLTESLF